MKMSQAEEQQGLEDKTRLLEERKCALDQDSQDLDKLEAQLERRRQKLKSADTGGQAADWSV